jgi:hypothetical protein
MREPRVPKRGGQKNAGVRRGERGDAEVAGGYEAPKVIEMGVMFSKAECEVIHRALWGIGWWYTWGTSDHAKIMGKLDKFFEKSREHLRRK